MTKRVHVITSAAGLGWAVWTPGSERAIARYESRGAAIKRGRDLAKKRDAVLYVHRKDGRISSAESYVRDRAGAYDEK